MSEAVTTAEIEDVLSAVRKLVSENAEGEASKGDASSEEVSKLVLTPAFRVHEDTEGDAENTSESQVNSAGEAPHIEVAEMIEAAGDVEADVINLNTGEAMRAVDAAEGASEHSETEDEAPAMSGATNTEAQAANTDTPNQESSNPEASNPDEAGSETAGPVSAASDDLAARIAELEAVVARASGQTVEEYEPDGSEEVTMPEVALRVEESPAQDGAQEAQIAPDAQSHSQDDATAHSESRTEDEASRAAQSSENEGEAVPLAAAEDASNEKAHEAQDWEDVDIDQLSQEAGPEAAPEDEVLEAEPYEDEDDELDAQGARLQTPEGTPEDALGDSFAAVSDEDGLSEDDDEELLLDEDTLREIVSRIVREELQGPMGERITQNLRRLVRREVKRALTMRGVE
ncbi:MAG: hypothetical protein ACRBCL_12415 [Maritimibacter sp.]